MAFSPPSTATREISTGISKGAGNLREGTKRRPSIKKAASRAAFFTGTPLTASITNAKRRAIPKETRPSATQKRGSLPSPTAEGPSETETLAPFTFTPDSLAALPDENYHPLPLTEDYKLQEKRGYGGVDAAANFPAAPAAASGPSHTTEGEEGWAAGIPSEEERLGYGTQAIEPPKTA